jgi:hypothetical protein
MTNDELAKAIRVEVGKIVVKIEAILVEVKRLSLDPLHIPKHEEIKTEESNQHTDQGGNKPTLSASNANGFGIAERADNTKDTANETKNKRTKFLEWLSRWKILMEWVGAAIILAYALVTYYTWKTIKESNRLSVESLQLTQRAVVTIGRSDGTVADFVIPRDPEQNAEIVVYFQNSGHLPAKFAWGTMVGFLAAGGTKKSTGITYTHPFKGLPARTRDTKNGSAGEHGAADGIIAGGSIFVSTLGTISQRDLAELRPSNMGTLILGMFEYCDELGTHSSREFGLRYRSNAPVSNLSFDLANEGSSVLDMMPLPKSTATTEYLPPCETATERERKGMKIR